MDGEQSGGSLSPIGRRRRGKFIVITGEVAQILSSLLKRQRLVSLSARVAAAIG
jgi:hypothetical protein